MAPGEEIGERGRVANQPDEFLDVRGRRNVSQLGDRPQPTISGRLERHADEQAGRKLRGDGPAGKRGDPEPADNHLENHFRQQNFLNFARLDASRLEDFCQERAFGFWGIDQESLGGEIFRSDEFFRRERVARGDDNEGIILEQWRVTNLAVSDRVANDGQIEFAIEERLKGVVRCLEDQLHFHIRKFLLKQ